MPWLWGRGSAPSPTLPVSDQGSADDQAPRRNNMLMSLWRITFCSVLFIILAVFIPVIPDVPASWKVVKDVLEYTIVAGFSGLVAYGELVSRYKDDPIQLLVPDPRLHTS